LRAPHNAPTLAAPSPHAQNLQMRAAADETIGVSVSDIFAAAERSMAEDAARKAKKQAEQEAERARTEAELRDKQDRLLEARQHLFELHSQVPKLHALLMRSKVPPAKLEESRLGRIRHKLARPEGPPLTADDTHRRGGWPLAEVPMMAKRRVVTGGNAWSGAEHGWRDVVVGGQGVMLLTTGELQEYRRFDSGGGVEIGGPVNPSGDLPPEFAMPRTVTDNRLDVHTDALTAAILEWSEDFEAAMVDLAKKAMKRLAESADSAVRGTRDDDEQLGGPGRSQPGLDRPAADAAEPQSASAWEAVKGRARQATQHINPLAAQHGIESLQGALTESGVAKIDKNTGQMKIKKTGIARAAIQPTRALRRAAEGAAVSEHLKAYNESRAALHQAGSTLGSGRPTAGSADEFASYASKRDYLRDWARRLVIAAGIPPAEQLILEQATMAATAITQTVLAQHATGLGPHSVPQGTPMDTFDTRYAKAVELAGGQQPVNEAIIAFLASRHDDWVQGICCQHG
jgi:hypothetical protein